MSKPHASRSKRRPTDFKPDPLVPKPEEKDVVQFTPQYHPEINAVLKNTTDTVVLQHIHFRSQAGPEHDGHRWWFYSYRNWAKELQLKSKREAEGSIGRLRRWYAEIDGERRPLVLTIPNPHELYDSLGYRVDQDVVSILLADPDKLKKLPLRKDGGGVRKDGGGVRVDGSIEEVREEEVEDDDSRLRLESPRDAFASAGTGEMEGPTERLKTDSGNGITFLSAEVEDSLSGRSGLCSVGAEEAQASRPLTTAQQRMRDKLSRLCPEALAEFCGRPFGRDPENVEMVESLGFVLTADGTLDFEQVQQSLSDACSAVSGAQPPADDASPYLSPSRAQNRFLAQGGQTPKETYVH